MPSSRLHVPSISRVVATFLTGAVLCDHIHEERDSCDDPLGGVDLGLEASGEDECRPTLLRLVDRAGVDVARVELVLAGGFDVQDRQRRVEHLELRVVERAGGDVPARALHKEAVHVRAVARRRLHLLHRLLRHLRHLDEDDDDGEGGGSQRTKDQCERGQTNDLIANFVMQANVAQTQSTLCFAGRSRDLGKSMAKQY
eukprot:4973888-Pleurochrysis_carterae.AAC.3